MPGDDKHSRSSDGVILEIKGDVGEIKGKMDSILSILEGHGEKIDAIRGDIPEGHAKGHVQINKDITQIKTVGAGLVVLWGLVSKWIPNPWGDH